MLPLALVIFDCDGVLVDSEHISHRVLHGMLVECGAVISYEETVERFIGSSTRGLLEGVGTLCAGQVPTGFLDRFRTKMLAAFAQELTAVPGVESMLKSLDLPHCVASNGSHMKIQFALRKTGLLGHFTNRIFSAEDVVHPKPAPDLFLHAARSLSVEPGRCVVIEDTPAGIRAAQAAGMLALGYAATTPGDRLMDAGAHEVFRNMSELRSVLGAATRQ